MSKWAGHDGGGGRAAPKAPLLFSYSKVLAVATTDQALAVREAAAARGKEQADGGEVERRWSVVGSARQCCAHLTTTK